MAHPTPTDPPAINNKPRPAVYGKIPPEILRQIQQMQAQSQNDLSRLGQLELSKAALVARITHRNAQIQSTLRKQASLLGLPENDSFEMTPDGTVIGNAVGN